MLRKYNKKMFLDYASAFDYYDEMKEEMKSWSLKKFQEFYDFTHYDWEVGSHGDMNVIDCEEIKQQKARNK